MKIFRSLGYTVLAELMFYLHVVTIVVVILGWLFPVYQLAYIIFLSLILLQHLVLGHCLLTTLEFYFRRKVYPNFTKTKASFSAVYMKKFFGFVLEERWVQIYSDGFIACMIAIELYLRAQ